MNDEVILISKCIFITHYYLLIYIYQNGINDWLMAKTRSKSIKKIVINEPQNINRQKNKRNSSKIETAKKNVLKTRTLLKKDKKRTSLS